MTRINLIDPSLLKGNTLIAEYRELPRIFNLVRNAIQRGETTNNKKNPIEFTLGKGHCRFFYLRLGWLLNRQKKIIKECLRRGYNIQHINPETLVEDIPKEWLGSWKPREKDIELSLNRIKEKKGLR